MSAAPLGLQTLRSALTARLRQRRDRSSDGSTPTSLQRHSCDVTTLSLSMVAAVLKSNICLHVSLNDKWTALISHFPCLIDHSEGLTQCWMYSVWFCTFLQEGIKSQSYHPFLLRKPLHCFINLDLPQSKHRKTIHTASCSETKPKATAQTASEISIELSKNLCDNVNNNFT